MKVFGLGKANFPSVSKIVIRVILSEKTLKINAVKWPRIYIQT